MSCASRSSSTRGTAIYTVRFQALYKRHGAALPAFRRLVLCKLLFAAALYLVEIAATLVTPVAINYLLLWTQDDAAGPVAGAVYVIVLGAAALIALAADYASEIVSKEAGAVCRMAASGAVYDKMMRMSSVDAQSTSSGELLALFASDSTALVELWHGTIGLVLQPLEIMGNIGLLVVYVDLATLGGVAVIVLALLTTNICGAIVERLSAERAAINDIRLRDVYELLLGMKVVKLNAWEPRFEAAILRHRANASAVARRVGTLLALINTISSNSVDLISLAVVLLYVVALGNPITPAVIFTMWVILGLLHSRIFHYPISLKHCKEGLVAARRLQTFLSQPEHRDSRLVHVATSSSSASAAAVAPVISVANASYSWIPLGAESASSAPAAGGAHSKVSASPPANDATAVPVAPSPAAPHAILRAVTWTVARGEFVAVAGMVGSGKSTLLASLLGETAQLAGSCALHFVVGDAPGARAAPISFVPQSAWVIHGTVRDNVLFGRPYDAARYAATLSACALDHDIAHWPQGDATFVGATTVSGGQRQRLSLARGVYAAGAALYLFDDVISALDQRVARQVVERCLCGPLLAGATRVVVTNSALVLNAADRIALLLPVAVARVDECRGSPAALSRGGGGSGGSGNSGSHTLVCGTREQLMANPEAAALLAQLSSGGEAMSIDELQQAGSGGVSPSADVAATGADALLTPVVAETRQRPAALRLDVALAAEDVLFDMRSPSIALCAGVGRDGSSNNDNNNDSSEDSGALLPGADGPASTGLGDAPAVEAAGASPSLPRSWAASPDPPLLPPPPPVTTVAAAAEEVAAVDAKDAPEAAEEEEEERHLPLPFWASFVMGLGGRGFAAGALGLLALEAAAVEVGVVWLAIWSADGGYAHGVSLGAYAAVYAAFVALEQAAAYARQHVYVAGTLRAGDALHRGLLFRLARAPAAFFDSRAGATGAVLQWFTRDLEELDAGTFYAAEYFWLGLVYAALIVIAQMAVTLWVLLPTGVAAAVMYLALREPPPLSAAERDAEARALREARRLHVEAAAAEEGGEEAEEGGEEEGGGGTPPQAAPRSDAQQGQEPVAAWWQQQRRALCASDLIRREAAAKGPLAAHFSASLEGLASVRAFGAAAAARFRGATAALLDAHTAALAAASGAQSGRVLRGNLVGALFYIGAVALIVPLRLQSPTPGISPGAAGFVVVNSCFASAMVNLVVEHAGALVALAHARARLLARVMELPQEDLRGAEEEEEKAGEAEASGEAPAAKEAAAAEVAAASVEVEVRGFVGDDELHPRPHPVGAGALSDVAVSEALNKEFGPYYAAAGGAGRTRPATFLPWLRRRLRAAAGLSPLPPLPPLEAGEAGEGAAFAPPLLAPPPGWPSAGAIRVRNLRMRYSREGPEVLRGVSLDIPAGCRVGLCGRTGSGKSSLLAALLRLVAPRLCAGSVTIDGVDTARLPLRSLRSRLAVISQDPLFFSGSLRRNLDPLGQFPEARLLRVLQEVRLQGFAAAQLAMGGGSTAGAAAPVAGGTASTGGGGGGGVGEERQGSSPPSLLDAVIAERGANLSLGEQQLLAAARAWLRSPRVLLCDEASASLDAASEEVLQAALRGGAFATATVLQVAHRLASVVQSHLVVVMADGEVVEAGHPWQLITAVREAAASAVGARNRTDFSAAVSAAAATTLPVVTDAAIPPTTSDAAANDTRCGFLCCGTFSAMVAAMPQAQQAELRRQAAAAFSRDLHWMRAHMPQYLLLDDCSSSTDGSSSGGGI